MAKKTKSFSHGTATAQLEQLAATGTDACELVYHLLRIFAGYGDGQVRRTKDGPGNAAKDGRTVLVKNLLAYRPMAAGSSIDAMQAEIEAMRADTHIAKHSPRIYMASDGHSLVAYDPKLNDWYDNTIALLWRDFEFLTPLAGIEKVQYMGEAEADVKSADKMAKLFDEIRRQNDILDAATVHAMNVFMSRLQFCFFAEDTGLFPGDNLFTDTIKTHTLRDGSDLADFIDKAFTVMSTRDEAVLSTLPDLFRQFPYVNGGLFRDHYPIPTLSYRARALIIDCGDYNWREINPDIFGSMIQAVVLPEHRAGLGIHYTSVPNIEKVIRPLFLDALNEEFDAACREAAEKVARGVAPERAVARLQALLRRLSCIKCFDPACGSGNFLIISYKRMRELEIRIWKAMRDIANSAILPISEISLTQFYGIELDEFACDTATLSLWLAEHQMNVRFHDEFGVQPETLPLKPSGHIVCGNACRLDWNTVCPHTPDEEVYIMGNPPYLGSRNQDNRQKEDGEIATNKLTGHRKLDYIANWFFKAAVYIQHNNCAAAFVTTNSICQGEQIDILWPAINSLGIEIGFAFESFKWSNNAKNNAGVTVNIIGIRNISIAEKYLYTGNDKRIVDTISPRLTSNDEIIVKKQMSPISAYLPEMRRGNMPNDHEYLRLSPEQRTFLIENYPKSEKFIRLQIGADEMINDIERYCFWIEDSDLEEAMDIPMIRDAVRNVYEYRINSKDVTLHKQAAKSHQFREFFSCSGDSLVVPIVSSERREIIPIDFVPKDTIVPNSAQVVYSADLLTFALLTSKLHNIWVRATAGRLENRFRYSIFLCYNTFPTPTLTELQKEGLERLAQNIIDIRQNNFMLTLGKMYNPDTMPEALRDAHRRLDLAVERAYRPEPFTSDEERLEHLFRLYAKMTKQ